MMLWYKAWLETRWRLVFLLVATVPALVAVLGSGAPPQRLWPAIVLMLVLMNCFAAVYLAGAGINTQTTYSAMQGFHGSMLFTLSLPVSRQRLFAVRAGLGALETCVYVAVSSALILWLRPVATTAPEALRFAVRMLLPGLAIYMLSAFAACFLDELWQFTGTCTVLGAIWLVQLRIHAIAPMSPLNGMNLGAYPISGPMPWLPLGSAVVATALLFSASVAVLDRKEF